MQKPYYIDVHTHLHLLSQRDLVLYWDEVSQVVVNGTSPKDWESVATLGRAHPSKVRASYGVHPWFTDSLEAGWYNELKWRLQCDLDAGVGEIGLDKGRRGGRLGLQKEIFTQQLKLARELNRPVSIHCVRAWGSLLEILRGFDTLPTFLLHGYSGSLSFIKEFVDMGAYFSLSPRHFDERFLDKVNIFKQIPRERVLIETDAPEGLGASITWCRQQKGFSDTIQHPMNIIQMYTLLSDVLERSLVETHLQIEENFWMFWKKNSFPLQQWKTIQ